MPNQRDPDKAFLGGYFPKTTVQRFHRTSVEAGYATNVDCLQRLIEDFIKSRQAKPTRRNGATARKAS